MSYLDIALNLPINKTFSYYFPDDGSIGYRVNHKMTSDPATQPIARIGTRVEVEFSGRRLTGFIVGIRKSAPSEISSNTTIKPILRLIDREAVFSQKTLRLAHWLSEYYFCSLGQALATMIPSGKRGKDYQEFAHPQDERPGLFDLNPEQKEAVERISQGILDNNGQRFLLHGVTGSGKTEVYRHLSKLALKNGRQVVILVPEISLTPQTIGRFAGLFPTKIAILHSRLSPAERITQWRRLAQGEAQIVIGARSAVFAPVKPDSLFIIDEEHESSYKADDCPRYHARQVAFYRTAKQGCLVLGSATPSLETLWHAEQGTLSLIRMTTRQGAFAEQEIRILDLKAQPPGSLVAPPLIKASEEAISRGEQALFFLNRRGYAPFLNCQDCEQVAKCPHCSISLTLHCENRSLLCHHCGFSREFNGLCPECGSAKVRTGGAGTERVFEFIKKRLPRIRLGRVDSDAVAGSRDKLFSILKAFAQKELDALVGTQMVAKGLDFPDLTVVGILAADAELNLPDFRSYERIHTQLVQVIGRAGRAGKKGLAFIQTAQPNEDPIASTIHRDSAGFVKRELERRRQFGWPPFSRLIRIVIRGKEPELTQEACLEIGEKLKAIAPSEVVILGPVPCPIEQRASWWRQHLLLKARTLKPMTRILREAGLAEGSRGKIYLEIDVDPINML